MNKLCPALSTNFHFPETTFCRLFASTWFRISQIQAFLKNIQIQASQEESAVRKKRYPTFSTDFHMYNNPPSIIILSNPELAKFKRAWRILKLDFLHNDAPREQISFH